MRVMPVVHFGYLASSVYLNPLHHAFKKNIFVALQQTTRYQNGTKVKQFQEFVPCTEVKNQPGYLDIDYTEIFYGD